MFACHAAKTNPYRFLTCAFVVVAACSAREPTLTPSPDPAHSTAVRPGFWTPPVPVTVVASAAPVPIPRPPLVRNETPTEEGLIREYEELARKKVPNTELEKFVSEHPKLLTASARPYGVTIMWVLEYEYEEAALVLLRAGAMMPPSALALAARGGLDGFVSYVLEKGADPNGGVDGGYGPLHQAAKYGHVSTVRKLLAAKALPNVHASNDGFTPLHMAVIDRKEEVVKVLLDAHADVEAKDEHGRTPLHWGPFAYRPQEVHVYMDIGGPHDTEYVDPGAAKAMAMLIDAGAKVNAVDDEGDTPLHEAARLGSVRGAQLLLARGAKTNVKNKAGETPLSIAKASDHRRSVLKVLERGR